MLFLLEWQCSADFLKKKKTAREWGFILLFYIRAEYLQGA
jgi:hypothetical protein